MSTETVLQKFPPATGKEQPCDPCFYIRQGNRKRGKSRACACDDRNSKLVGKKVQCRIESEKRLLWVMAE